MNRHPSAGWTRRRAAELCSLITSGSRGWAKYYADTGAGFIRVQNVRRGRIDLDLDDLQHVRPPSNAEGSRTRLRPNDIAITITADLGRVGLVGEAVGEAYVNQHVALARPTNSVEPAYLAWFITGPDAQEQMGLLDRGATRSGLSLKDIEGLLVPLPPLAEQRRIVARIEALFARTRRARADLERIAPLSRRYVEAATDRAFTPGEDSAWTTTTAGQLCDIKSGVTLGKRYAPAAELIDCPYLRVANVQRGHLRLDEVKTIRLSAAEAYRLVLRDGDILMNEGGDRDKLGRGWVWEGQIQECVYQNHVFRLRLRNDVVTPKFVSRYANHAGARYFLDQGKQTTNLASISMSKIAALPIPVPPAGEAARIDLQLDATDRSSRTLQADANRALALLNRLEQSILARAFRGELVPQDPAEAVDVLAPVARGQEAPTARRRRTHAAAA